MSYDNPDTTRPVEAIFPRVIDFTILSQYHRCPHSFFRRHGQGLTKKAGGVNVHLHFGGAVAHGLEHTRREYFAHHDSADAIAVGARELIKFWGDFELDRDPTRSEVNKKLSNALCLLVEYFKTWPLDTDPMQIWTKPDGTPGVEISFAVPIGLNHPDTGEPLIYSGRFDMLGVNNDSNTLWGVDDKTTSSLGDEWAAKWRMRGQFIGYTWGALEFGYPLAGFQIRGASPRSSTSDFAEALIPCPKWKIERWLAQTRADIDNMIVDWNTYLGSAVRHAQPLGEPNSDHFSRRFDDACTSFGGCEFLDLCNSRDPDTWLSEYRVQRWNPLARDVEGAS